MANTSQSAARSFFRALRFFLGLAAGLASAAGLRAQLNFDVFAGHGLGAADSCAMEASWFPVTCEIQNDGPSFNAIVEISGGQFGGAQARRVAVELPTHTKKRFTVPLYCASRYGMSVDALLLNEKGNRTIAERRGIPVRTVVDWQSTVIASLSRTHGGAASLPEGPNNGNAQLLRPVSTHLSVDLFPDNPLTLESLTAIYLHSSKASELKVPQANALLAWVHGGGHLILGVEQAGDVNSVPWLQQFLPCTLGDSSMRAQHGGLQEWLRTTRDEEPALRGRPVRGRNTQGNQAPMANPYKALSEDSVFESAGLSTILATVRDGTVLIGTDDAPLAVQAARGRGRVTVLLFSPELEPFRSWRNRNWFWAKLGGVPMEWLANVSVNNGGSMSLDGVFGAMVDSKQIRKLPVGWLLLLLLAYLVVIGPLDQYWLKKINRQMLTWITFPSYVVFFSLLIYFIGYKLRSGEMEWNELHVVDVTTHGARADLRGRVYASAYSPANARYPVASDQGYSTLRGEIGSGGGAQEVSKATIEQRGNGFVADLTVPVWTSQMFVNDWWKQGATPVSVTITPRGDQFDVKIENPSGKKIPQARLVFAGDRTRDGGIIDLGDITKGRTLTLSRWAGSSLQQFVQGQVGQFNNTVQQRQQQFGAQEGGHLSDIYGGVFAASFLGTANLSNDPNQPWNPNNYWSRFVTPSGFDLTSLIQRGDAVLIAWMPGETIDPTLNQFSPRYSRKDTVLRLLVEIQGSKSNAQGQ